MPTEKLVEISEDIQILEAEKKSITNQLAFCDSTNAYLDKINRIKDSSMADITTLLVKNSKKNRKCEEENLSLRTKVTKLKGNLTISIGLNIAELGVIIFLIKR